MKVDISFNTNKNGVELRFDEKPDEATTSQLKAVGFKYSYRQNMWYASKTNSIVDFANNLKVALESGETTIAINIKPSFSASEENIDHKNFSYVSISAKDDEGKLFWENYIVFEPSKNIAEQLVSEFAKETFGDKLHSINIYPRNYVRKARQLFKEGNIIGEKSEQKEVQAKEPSAKPLVQSDRPLSKKEKLEILNAFGKFARKRQADFGNLEEGEMPLLFSGWLRVNHADLSDRKNEIWEEYYTIQNILNPDPEKPQIPPKDYHLFFRKFREQVNKPIEEPENESTSTEAFASWLDENYSNITDADKKALTGNYDNWLKEKAKNLKALENLSKPKKMQPYSAIFNKLQKLIPNLNEHLETGTPSGKSVLDSKALMDLSYDFLGQDKKGRYLIALAHYFSQNGDLVPDPDMQIRIDLELETGEAMHYQDQFGYRPVYVFEDGKELVNLKEKKEQNKFLSGWLSNLLNQGHKLELEEVEKEAPQKSIKESELLKDAEEEIEIPFTKQTGYRGSIRLRTIPEKGFSYGNSSGKEFGDFSGSSSPSTPVSDKDIFSTKEKALKAAFDEHVKTLAAHIQSRDSIYNNEEQKLKKLRKALDELIAFAKTQGITISQIPDKSPAAKEGSIDFILPAAWKMTDDEYPQNKVLLFGNPYNQSKLRTILLDRIEATFIESQLELVKDIRKRFKERAPIKLESSSLVTQSKSGEKKHKAIIRNYLDDLILDNEIWKVPGATSGVLEYLVRYLLNEKTPAVKPESKPDKKPSNQHDLNLQIEEFIVEKDAEDESYSEEDKQFIAQYTGSGGLIKQGASGKGVLYEYFTPEVIVQKMWGLAYKFGYSGGAVLEPSCGTGNFFKYAPKEAELVGYEINPYSVRIAEIIYPNASIYQQSFETLFFAGNTHLKDDFGGAKYELVIGNPPYGEFSGKWAGMGEKKWTGATEYDQYFITRGLDLLLPGGVLVFIIPSAFLTNNSKYNKLKEKVAAKADLVDAYRLPARMFKTTDIGTDIIVLKKRTNE